MTKARAWSSSSRNKSAGLPYGEKEKGGGDQQGLPVTAVLYSSCSNSLRMAS